MKQLAARNNANLWALIRRAVALIFCALGVVLIGSRVNRSEDLAVLHLEVEACLLEQAADITIDTRSPEEAAASLKQSFKTRIDLSPQFRPPDNGAFIYERDKRHREGTDKPIHLQNTTLGQAIAAVMRQFDLPVDQLDFRVMENSIFIGPAFDMQEREPLLIRVYELPPWITDNAADALYPESYIDGSFEDRADAIKDIFGRFWNRNAITTWQHYLIVQAPATVQRDVQRLLFLVHHPAGRGAAKSPALTVNDNKYQEIERALGLPAPPRPDQDQVIRVYDVQELLYAHPRQNPIEQLVRLVQESINPPSWREHGGIGEIHLISGKLIVTQSPQNQDQVAILLDSMRKVPR